MFRWTAVAYVLAIVGCDNGDGGGSLTEGSGSSTGSGSGKAGFSADLAKQLSGGSDAKTGSGSDAKAGSDTKVATSGSDTKVASGSGSDTKAGSGSDTKAGSDAVAMTGSGSDAKAGSGSAKPVAMAGSGSDAKAGGSAVAMTGSGSAKAEPASTGSGSSSTQVSMVGSAKVSPPIADPTGPRVYVKPSAELAAIKLSLGPNWERDVGEAGTISLSVRIPGTNDAKIFVFHYGLEQASAPADRDKYIQWLRDQKLFDRKTDRQRGGSWMIEGEDGAGVPSFRFAVRFGSRWVICGGPTYKDAASNKLGDIRDQTVLQAKSICENATL